MLHLVLCFGIWTLIFTSLFWRLMAIAKQAIAHLQRLHQIPCNKCAYFTGDYRLKCTVNPTEAMSETAIGCRDFLYSDRSATCSGCLARNESGKSDLQKKPSRFLFNNKLFQ